MDTAVHTSASIVGSASAFDAVLFDCDGVLVDSEAITCGATCSKNSVGA